MNAFDWFLVAWLAVAAIATVSMVGKPRKPITPTAAAITVVIDAGLIVWLVVSHG